MRLRLIKPFAFGISSGLGLVAVYLLIMGFSSGSWSFTISELIRLKFWVAALVIGFGTQIGLFSYLKSCQMAAGTEGTAATSTATSTVAMIACCAHHLTDVLPFLGLTVATAFLAKYQEWFLAIGILSNLIGILLMVRHIKK